ncbi:MAG TPA: hypothetical protein VIU02_01580 [Burkholderiales bacterium]
MHTNHIRFRIGGGQPSPAQRPGLLRKLVAAVVGTLILIGAFMLSVVVLAAVAAVGLVGGAYLWWRTRELRKRLREHAQARPAGGRVIDGEVIRDVTPR